MGDDELSNGFREKLERELDELQPSLKRENEANKPPPPPPPPPPSTSEKQNKNPSFNLSYNRSSSGENSFSVGLTPR